MFVFVYMFVSWYIFIFDVVYIVDWVFFRFIVVVVVVVYSVDVGGGVFWALFGCIGICFYMAVFVYVFGFVGGGIVIGGVCIFVVGVE